MYGSSKNTLIHNITYANEDSGLQCYSSASENIVVGNLSYGNGDHGIDNYNSPDNIVVGNTVQGNYTAGINFEGDNGTTFSSRAIIKNNISVDNGINPVIGIVGQKSNIRVDAGSIFGTTMDYNLVYLSGAGDTMIQWKGVNYATLSDFQAAGTGQEVNGIEADPLFVSPVAYATRPAYVNVVVGNYHIQTGSPAIDSANSAAHSESSTDLDGNLRWDDPAVANTGFSPPRAYDDRGAYERQQPLLTNLVTDQISGTYGLTVTLTATLTRASDSSGIDNKTLNFSLNGVAACNATTDINGDASCTTPLPLLDDVGDYPTGVNAVFSGDWFYGSSTDSAQLSITTKALTVTGITAVDRPYDGTTVAELDTRSYALVGVVGSDDVALDATSGLGTLSDANVGDGKLVTVSGLALSGTKALNYTLTQPTTTANITAKELTVTGITAVDRPYDGTTIAELDTSSYALIGVVGSEGVTLNVGSAVGTFSDANVADSITVTVSGLTLSGADIGNYTLIQPTTTANITAMELTVTGITAANRTYDGTTAAVLDTSLAALVGVVGVEDVTLDANSALGTFSDANVADGITVTVSGLTLIGEDIANYTLTQPTTTANITAKHITGSFTAADKVFDGTNTATVLTRSLTGVIGLEDVVLNGGTATFEDANVGVYKIVTLEGATLGGLDMNNYILDLVATTTASITPIVYQIYLPLILR